MSAGKYDFKIEQGTSFSLSLVYKDADGNVVNLTDWCARLVWKSNAGVIQSFSTDNMDYSQYRFFIDGPNGKLILQLPANTTNTFNFSTAKYDIELQSPDDFYLGSDKYTTRLLSGTVTIVKRYSQTAAKIECSNE